MASTVAGLSEIEPEIAQDPAAWYRHDGGLLRAASYPPAHVAEAVGDHLGMSGPRCAVSAACASSAMAIALAANMLLDGAAPMMLAGGSDALCPFTLSGFNSLQALDPEPCRPFDQNRKGLNLGEGAAVLVLETLDRGDGAEGQRSGGVAGMGHDERCVSFDRAADRGERSGGLHATCHGNGGGRLR